MSGYYYILSSGIRPDFFLKLGITTRHPKYQIDRHQLSYPLYELYWLIKLDADKLFDLERYVLAKTFAYNFNSDLINNECRYKIDPAYIKELIVSYLGKNHVNYEVVSLADVKDDLDNTNEDAFDFAVEYFSSIDELNRYLDILNAAIE